MVNLVRLMRPSRTWLVAPTAWHVASLFVAVSVFAIVGARQWFFGDEWAFLAPSNDGNVFEPHVGHWSASPFLITKGLQAVFGMTSYWPFLAVAMAIHLAIAHVLWRIMNRVGVDQWISTSLAFMFMVLGAGSENILWAFQTGFMGAMLLGLIVVLLVDHSPLTVGRRNTVVALSIWALTFSGTALALIAAAGLLSLIRSGFRSTILLFAPAGIAYATWYLLFARDYRSPFAASGLIQIGVDVPRYVGAMFVEGLGSVLPIAGLGVVCVVALLAWFTFTVSASRGVGAIAYVLMFAALLQAGLTAYSRLQLGEATASSGRYVYAIVALLLPAIGLAFTWGARNRRSVIAVVITFVLIVAAFNAALLARSAAQQSARELSIRDKVFAAIALASEPDAEYDPGLRPEPQFSPDITLGDLLIMVERGWIEPGSFSPEARLSTLAVIGIERLATQPSAGECTDLTPGSELRVPAGSDSIIVRSTQPDGGVDVVLVDEQNVGEPRFIALEPGWNEISLPDDVRAILSTDLVSGLCATISE